MRKSMIPLVVVLASLFALAQAQVQMTFASAYAPDDHQTLAMEEFARLAEEYTDGEVVINIAAGGVLGGERDVAEGIQLGTIDGAILGGILQNFDPAMAILEFPFLFRNTEHVNAVMQGEVGDQIRERLVEQTGIRALGYVMRTPRQLTTLRRVDALEDIRGMQIRVPEMQAHLETWRALGANPTPIAFTEVYNALQQGVVDGQENPIGVIYANAFGEVVNYLAWTDHLVGFMLITISDQRFSQLTPEQQDGLLRAAEEARRFNDEQLEALNAEWVERLGEQVTYTEPDMGPWREAVADVPSGFYQYDGFQELYEGIVEVGENL
jgi:TRAP-type transport system periplasmic protein